MARQKIKIRIFVGDRPLEELTAREREDFGEKCARRMGESFNSWFACHPEEFNAIKEKVS